MRDLIKIYIEIEIERGGDIGLVMGEEKSIRVLVWILLFWNVVDRWDRK